MNFAPSSHLSAFGRLLSLSEREAARPGRVSWFGWNGCRPAPAMTVFRAGGPSGSRIAEGNRHGRREAHLDRTARRRDHAMARDISLTKMTSALPVRKIPGDHTKVLDPEHSRSVVLRLLSVESCLLASRHK
jgi:hypothetical protein